jgi:hypothetical protein
MSSAYSGATQYSAPVSTLDIAQLTTTVQSALQGRYDANVAKVDSLIQQYTSVPLVRAEDKQYLGERLQSMLTSIDQNAKINWTSGLATREVNARLAGAIDDKVLKQMSNSQAIINFEQTAAERKAKNPELYNDANYVYSKDKAGYAEYMTGQTDDIGSLQYIDYYDVKKNLTDEVEKYAKERGFEKILNQETQDYIFVTQKGKEVKPEEIENFVKTAISSDSRLQQQLLIDSHAKYRGLKDEQVLESYKTHVNEQVSSYDKALLELDNEAKNTNKDDKQALLDIEKTRLALTENKKQLLSSTDPKNFNRDLVQYNEHTSKLINNYVKTYSYKETTDVEFDDILMKIEKHKKDMLETESTSTASASTGLNAGQTYDRAETPSEKEAQVSNFTKVQNDANQAWGNMDKLIRANLTAVGRSATDQDVVDYFYGIKQAAKKGFNLNATGYTDEEIQAYYNVVANNTALGKATNIAKTRLGSASEEILTGLFGGKSKDLNVEGLALTMPYTAQLLGKYNNASQMSSKEKAIALIEVATNAKNELTDEDDKKYYDLYINDVKRQNKITNAELNKVAKSGEQPGFWSSVGDVVLAHGQDIARATGNVFSAVIDPFRRSESYKQSIQEAEKERKESLGRIGSAYSNLGRSFSTDRSLDDIQSGDINLKDYRAPKKVFTDALDATKKQVEIESEKYRKSLPAKKSIILNPDIKTDKALVEQVKSAIIASGGVPQADTYINIVDVSNGMANIKYQAVTDQETAKGGLKKYTLEKDISIPVSNLPPSMLNRLEGDLPSYVNSIKNPTKTVRNISYTPPENYSSKSQFEQDFIRTSGGSLSEQGLKTLRLEGMTDVKTKEDFLKEISILPVEIVSTFRQDLDSKYNVVWERPEGGGAFIGRLMKNGEEVMRQNIQEDFKPHLFKLYTVNYTNMFLDKRVEELKTAYRRSRE